ncbi:MAG: glycosyltransferase family 2 protein [Thermoleophilia bacterium]
MADVISSKYDIGRTASAAPFTDLSIIIINWNTRELLRECLEHLQRGTRGAVFEVIVVDNGSTDGSADLVSELFPDYKLIRNIENRGFASANNQAIRESKGAFIALVNTDTMVSPGSLAAMTNYLKKYSDVAAAGCQLVDGSGRRQISGGIAPSIKAAVSQTLFLPSISFGRIPGIFVSGYDSRRVLSVDWLCAACMVVRRHAIDQVGKLNEEYFMYAEDMEWGLRMRAGGWKMHILPWIKVTHYGGASSATPDKIQTLWLDGICRVARKYQNREHYIAFGVILSFAYAVRSAGLWMLAGVSRSKKANRLELKKRSRALRYYAGYLARQVLRPQ